MNCLLFMGICPHWHSGFSPTGKSWEGLGKFIGSAAHTKVCLRITKCTGAEDSSWVSWQMFLDLTTPTEALLLMDGCLISC